MNTIGISNNLDRPRIRKLLSIGLFASVLTGIGDFLLGYASAEETAGSGLAASILASAPNLTDGQLIAGGLLGFFGIFLEGLCYFAVYVVPIIALSRRLFFAIIIAGCKSEF